MHTKFRSPARFLALFGMFVAAIAVPLALDPAVGIHSDPEIIAVNCLPSLLLVLILFALTRKALLSLLLACIPIVVLHFANHLKLQDLGNVVMLQDVVLLPQIASNPDLFGSYMHMSTAAWLLLVAALAVLGLLAWKEPKLLPGSRAGRALLLVIGVGGLGFLGSGNARVQSYYRFDPSLRHVGFPTQTVARVGLVGSMLYFNSRAHGTNTQIDTALIDGYLASHAAAIAGYRQPVIPALLPDIIVVQSESLFDPSTLAGMQDSGVFDEFHAMQQRSTSGFMASPAFGGVTIKAEFEVLTGYPYVAFREVVYPYYGTVNSTTNSLPRLLAKSGYRTAALHPYQAGFWNRKTTFSQLGFGASHFSEAFEGARKEGPYTADEEVFTRALRLAEQPGPDFVFAITMENHGPWRWKARLNAETALWSKLPVPAGLDDEETVELQKYLWHVQQGEQALAKLAAAVEERKEPTILVVYGDHLPAMSAFFDAPFVDGRGYRKQRVPYFIFDNRKPNAKQVRLDRSLYFLPGMILEQAGLPMNRYFAIVASAEQGYVPGDAPYSTPTDSLMVEMARADYNGKLPR
jgi:phosphoglycerol transferase MdoB-like AlkP superfamily enzyme